MTGNYRIGQILVKKGIVNDNILEKALTLQEKESPKNRRKIGEILISEFNIDRNEVFRELALTYGFREFDPSKEPVDEERIKFIKDIFDNLKNGKKETILNKRLLPFKVDKKKNDVLIILSPEPTDRDISDIAVHTGFSKYEIFYSPSEFIEGVYEKIGLHTNEFLRNLDEIQNEIEVIEENEEINEETLDREINKGFLVNLVEGSLVEAVKINASDIHVIPKDNDKVEIHFRIDGKLRLWHLQENTKPEAMAAVFKDLSRNIDRFERESAQDGFIQRKIDGYIIRFRVSILPIVGMEFERKLESIVIRVLDDRKMITDLDELGLHNRVKAHFIDSISKPQGLVILTGPTGCGKSTTLLAALSYVMKPSLNILTVEEPVEYLIKGARQLKIGHKMDFEQAMRAILRHDPDIVMVGEIRDLQTAEIGIKLANTGHLTFSTLHTNDAPSVVSRLYKMGVEPFLIAYAINIVVAQRLVRALCLHCKKEIKEISPSLMSALDLTEEELITSTFYDAVGCNKCYSGYKGRAAIHEVLYFDKEIRNIILKSANNIDEDTIKEAGRKNGMLTLRESGRELVKKGITTCEEILCATTED
ncbi:MAG TPA: type II/IV secretion system protein [bacterium]|nr:type II/IV secretion system protein [bacterium]